MNRSLALREVLFLAVSAVLGAVFGYEVGLRVGVALAPRHDAALMLDYSLWPAAIVGAVVGVLVFVPLLWTLRASPDRASVARPRPVAVRVGAPPGTYGVAVVRGALAGALLGVLAAVIGVVLMLGTADKWFSSFALVFGQLGAAIGVILGGIFEPLRVRWMRRRALLRTAAAEAVLPSGK